MPLPKKIKKNLPLTESKILLARRQELLDKINKDGTYLPKSLLHADLDGGFLDFVKNELKLSVDGKLVPNVDILMTTQNWAQFTQTWDFQNIDKNAEPPFITVVRTPEVKYGTNPATLYTIPATTTTVVSNIAVCNNTSTAGTFTILLNDIELQKDTAISGNSTIYIDLKQVLPTTQTIKGLASAITIDFHISGVEIS